MSESTLEQVKRMAQGLRLSERVILVEELAHGLGQESAGDQRTPSQSLRGSWRGKFPDDFDIDSALHEIRHEWEEELPDGASGTRAEEGSDRR